MGRLKALAAAVICGLIAASPASTTDKTAAQPFWVEEIVSGLNVPWSMVWTPDGELLILEKFGGLRVVRSGHLSPVVIPGTPKAYKVGPNGLLDIALDPDFKKTRRVFITFDDGDAVTSQPSLFRARYDGKALVDGEVIFRTDLPATVAPYSSLTRIVFLPDKTMLVSSAVGDPRRLMAQRLDNHLGKILRLDRDGHAPPDNPFVGRPGAKPEIFAYGVRNAIGLYRDPRTGVIWEAENAMRGGDELNILKAGANYGWPIATHGLQYSGEKVSDATDLPGVEPPITYWVPSIAPSGLTVAQGRRYPGWNGDVFAGALSGQHLRHVTIRDGKAVAEEKLLTDLGERIRDVRTGPDGFLYVLTDNVNGRLLRLRPGKPGDRQMMLVAHKLTVRSNPTVDTLDMRPKPSDPARGGRLFAQVCSGCHSVRPNDPPGPGPNLAGVVGRKAGSGGFAYSDALKGLGVTWNPEAIENLLAGPQAFAPGTLMASPPIADPQDRRDIVAFLKG